MLPAFSGIMYGVLEAMLVVDAVIWGMQSGGRLEDSHAALAELTELSTRELEQLCWGGLAVGV